MYSIYVGPDIVEICENPRYLKSEEDEYGTRRWVPTKSYDEAEILSVHGDFYNIPGKIPVEGIEEEVIIVDDATGTQLFRLCTLANSTDAALKTSTEEVETALCEMEVLLEERAAEIENALCDMDAMLS